jgi:16S rRNA (guanine527-N7)-methyltransferase
VVVTREPLPTRVEATPELPAGYGRALDAGVAALGLDLPEPARTSIDGHVRLLLAWTDAINLTAIRDPETVAIAHVTDSLSAVEVLRERGVDRFIDLGSGGGFPGLPVAAALPAARGLLIEPVVKKARFLTTTIEATGLSSIAEAAAVRAEALARDGRHRGQWPAVIARAVANLADLIEMALPLLEPGGILVAWKRGDLAAELVAADRALVALGGGTVEILPVTVPGLTGHRLIVVTAHRRVAETYPRDPAVRKRRPW